MNELTAAVIEYINFGYHILAISGKRPNPRYHSSGWSWGNSIYGSGLTEDEIAELARIFQDPTTTGVALIIPKHVVVADVDTDAAAALLTKLAPNWQDYARVSRTPKGLHLWFLAPGAEGSTWLGEDGKRVLLLKGYGGYVVAPPSLHFDDLGRPDGVYRWLGDWRQMDWLPEGLAERLRLARALQSLRPISEVIRDPEKPKNLDGLSRIIIEAPDGQQNSIIHWAAQRALEDGVPYEVAYATLMDAARKGRHPTNRAHHTITGVYRRAGRIENHG